MQDFYRKNLEVSSDTFCHRHTGCIVHSPLYHRIGSCIHHCTDIAQMVFHRVEIRTVCPVAKDLDVKKLLNVTPDTIERRVRDRCLVTVIVPWTGPLAVNLLFGDLPRTADRIHQPKVFLSRKGTILSYIVLRTFAFGNRIAIIHTVFYGRSDAPHCSFRSNCQVKAILHAKWRGRPMPPLSKSNIAMLAFDFGWRGSSMPNERVFILVLLYFVRFAFQTEVILQSGKWYFLKPTFLQHFSMEFHRFLL